MLQPNSPHSNPDNNFGSSLVPVQTESTGEYYLKQGKSLYQSYLAKSRQPDLDAAVRNFQKAVEVSPDLAEAYVQLASALWDQGAINLDLAQFYCQTAIKLDPKQTDAYLFLGYFLQRSGLMLEAGEAFEAAIKRAPFKSARPRIALGNVMLKQSLDTLDKKDQITLAVRGTGQFIAGFAMLPMDKATCGVLKDAFFSDFQVYGVEMMAKGLKTIRMHSLSRNVYEWGAQMMPADSYFYQVLGDEYFFDVEEPSKAVEYYEKALAVEPNNLTVLRKLGKAYAETGQTVMATDTYSSVIELEPGDAESLYQLGQLHTENKDYFKALYYLKEAENVNPNNPYVQSTMAYVLYKMNDVDGAYIKYKRALDCGTDTIWLSTIAQTLGTIAYQVHQNLDAAVDYLQQAVQYHPENLEAVTLLADVHFENDQLERALSVYKTLLEINPRNADCYSNIGYILWQMDKNDAAIDAYRAALHFDPLNAVAYNNLGVIYLDEESDADKALPLFKKAFALDGAYTLACFNIGRSLQMQGKRLEAAEMFAQAQALNIESPELEDSEIQSHIEHLFN